MTTSKQRPTGDALAAASGHWPEILQTLGGLTADQLENRHQPCPACGGTDRYRWDKDEAEGGAYCSRCGGKDHQGGAMTGIDLLMRVKGWHFLQAIDAVGRHLGLAPIAANNRRSTGKPYRCPEKPPADAPPPALDGAVAQWCYRDTTGAQLYWVQRYQKRDGSKGFIHRVWLDGRWHRPNTSKDGFTCDWPEPRPMYGLPGLVQRPDSPVLVAEGEKAADAAAGLFPDHVVVSWSNGSSAIGKVDWAPLRGRSVTLWPDNDDQGREAMQKLSAQLLVFGCSVSVADYPADSVPAGWDLADAVADGWTPEMAAGCLSRVIREVDPPEKEPPVKSWTERNHRKLSHTRRMACFERCIEVQAARERNSLRRRARLLKAAADLEVGKYVNRQEISQRILEVKDRQGGRSYKSLTAADRAAMERPRVEWLIPGLIPARDMTIIGGRAKVGKTRLAMALAAAFLTGASTFELGEPAPGPVIVVSDDQGDGDTADMLHDLGIWDHPRLIWSPNFRLTEDDLDSLLQDVKANPGALVILDSLRSISRQLQHGENDPELGVMLYDLKAAVTEAGGTPVLIHHCNKAEGLTGVEALSGHNSISGAVNGVITLHHLIDDKGRPRKDDPQRRMVRQARSGQDVDLVISPIAGTGRFYKVGTFADWQRQQQEAEAEQKAVEKLSKDQKRILEVLEDSGQWMTRRQVCDALGVDWGEKGKGAGPKGVWNRLSRLVEKRLAESQRAGNESTYRASCSALESESMESLESPSGGKGSEDSKWLESMESPSGDAGFSPPAPENPGGDKGIPRIPSGGIPETDCRDKGIPEIPRIPASEPTPARIAPGSTVAKWSKAERRHLPGWVVLDIDGQTATIQRPGSPGRCSVPLDQLVAEDAA